MIPNEQCTRNYTDMFSVKNQCEIITGRLSNIADVNMETVHDHQPINFIEKSIAQMTLHRKNSYKTPERIKLIKHAKRLGFNSTEIRDLQVYWSK